MVRVYKRKTDRGSYGATNLADALQAINNGLSINRASKDFGVPQRTLRRHRDKEVAHPGVQSFGRCKSFLPSDIELNLKEHVINMQRRFYGLRMEDLRHLAFDLCEKAKISHPFNKETKLAGKDWVRNFIARHNLTVRQPVSTSIARFSGFNRSQVQRFFDIYKDSLACKSYSPAKIWNMDETGLSTVQKPGRILAAKGARQVGKATSDERGTLVTLVCACSAAGVFLPPMFIFPRKRMVESLMNGAPPQSVGYASQSGWTDAQLFIKWIAHFADFTNASPDNPQLILLDGHHSHKTLEAIEFCRDKGIELISFPPHCTHKLQPLDRTYFKALKASFNAEADNWMVSNQGQRITVHNMAALSGKAFLRTALPEKAVNGFKTCGLEPFDPNVFTEADFEGVLEMDEPRDVDLLTTTDGTPAGNGGAPYVREATLQNATEVHQAQNEPTPSCIPPRVDSSDQPTCSTTMEQPASHIPSSTAAECMSEMRVIKTSGDGRCFFRSLVTGLDVNLQSAERDEHGKLTSVVMKVNEKSQADGLRARAISYMCSHFSDYADLDEHTLNADLPPWIHFSTVEERIAAMAEPQSLPGELEICATSKVINKQIIVINSNNVVIQRYGQGDNSPLIVQFTSIGEDVGHFDCVIKNTAPTETSSTTSNPNDSIMDIINSLSPIPNMHPKRKSGGRKREVAEVLTSSPYKAKLMERQAKKKATEEKKKATEEKKKVAETNKKEAESRKKPKAGNSKTRKGKRRRQESDESSDENEEWPCLVCGELFCNSRSRETWIQCQMCLLWAHEQCTPGLPYFICPNCESETESE